MSMKNCIDTIGNRTRERLIFSAVPLPNEPPRGHKWFRTFRFLYPNHTLVSHFKCSGKNVILNFVQIGSPKNVAPPPPFAFVLHAINCEISKRKLLRGSSHSFMYSPNSSSYNQPPPSLPLSQFPPVMNGFLTDKNRFAQGREVHESVIPP